MIPHTARRIGGAAAMSLALAAPAAGQEAAAPEPPGLELSLNTIGPVEGGGCRLTFVIRNGLAADLAGMVAEAVLFDGAGHVDRITLFDFGALPAGRPRVRQFDLDGPSCDTLGQVLINGFETCEGEGLAPGACLEGLRLSSETGIEVTG
jgi:hypothetical protein